MKEQTDTVIERARVREVAGVCRSPDALDAAVAGLLLSGFDRTDVDLMGEPEVLRRRLGIDHVPVEKLADLPAAAAKPYLGSADLAATLSTLAGILIFVGAAGAALLVVASGGSWWRSVAAGVGGVAAGAALVAIVANRLKRAQEKELEQQLAAGGIVLWVRARSSEREKRAQQILRAHGAEAIRVHEIEVEKRLEDLPLRFLHREPA